MKCNVFATLVLSWFCFCQGLEFVLNRNVLVSQGPRAVCGVLLCEEKLSQDVTALSKDNGNGTAGGVSTAGLTSMTIYKKVPHVFRSIDEDPRGDAVASVTAQHPNVTRVYSGVKLLGVLEAQKATVRLELFVPDDCRSDFTCQVTGVDAEGSQFSSAATLLQEPSNRAYVNEGGSCVVDPHMQFLIQKLDTNLELVKRSVEKLEDNVGSRFASVEHRFENKIDSVERDFSEKLESLEDKSYKQRLEDRLNLLENRIEDKIEHGILEKLYQLDSKLSLCQNDKITQSDIDSVLLKMLSTLKVELKSEAQKILQGVINETRNLLSSIEGSLIRKFTALDTDVTARDRLAINQSVVNDIISAQHDLQDSFEQLPSLFFNRSREAYSPPTDFPKLLNTTISEHLKSVIQDILTPKTCEKGLAVLSLSTSYPHPLIYPSSGIPGYGEPYLCDTTTDGGGWIILQRRTTGNVDFYRDWAAYKKGFGSLDDDFWMGNDRIHAITSNGTWELRVDLRFKGKAAFAHYLTFKIADEENKYALAIGPYDGTAGDSLRYHNGQQFSTFDKDNDKHGSNCAKNHIGAWWYNACDQVDLNSKWNGGSDKGLEWNGFTGSSSASFSEMKIRRVS